MNTNNRLTRFLDAQNQMYLQALSEVRSGKKVTHWIWFIFPQIKGLGYSDTAKFYGIRDLEEASEYLAHPVLGKHLLEITTAVLESNETSATDIFGSPDDIKLRSSMTLFAILENAPSVFNEVLNKYFHGSYDEYTLELLQNCKSIN